MINIGDNNLVLNEILRQLKAVRELLRQISEDINKAEIKGVSSQHPTPQPPEKPTSSGD